jgi:hypothetical protein
MPITDSRNKGGTLSLDGQPFAKQMTAVTLTPATAEEGDPVETLDGSTITADEVSSWTLELGAIQDFTDPAGFVRFCFDNAGDVVAFAWSPNGATGPDFTGSCKVRPVAIGGDVNARLTATVSFAVEGTPTWADAA